MGHDASSSFLPQPGVTIITWRQFRHIAYKIPFRHIAFKLMSAFYIHQYFHIYRNNYDNVSAYPTG